MYYTQENSPFQMCSCVIPANPIILGKDEGMNVLEHQGVGRIVEDKAHPLEKVMESCVPGDVLGLHNQVPAQFQSHRGIDGTRPGGANQEVSILAGYRTLTCNM